MNPSIKPNKPAGSCQITRIAIALAVLLASGIAACHVLTGCASTVAPTKTESALYSTLTNIVTVTNTVPVPVAVYHTNEIALLHTNELLQVTTVISNVVNQTWVTNLVPVAMQQTNYSFVTKPEVADTVTGIGSLINMVLPGTGSLATEGVLALLAGWGHWRSRQRGQTGAALVQEVQTARAFMQKLPNGAAYDQAFVTFLKDHQQEADVVNNVLGLIEANVSNPDAQAGATAMITLVNSLKVTGTPIVPAPGV